MERQLDQLRRETMDKNKMRDDFEREGYFVLEGLISQEELGECAREIERLHEVGARLRTAGDVRGSEFQLEPNADDDGEGLPVLRKIEKTRNLSAVFRRLAEHPNLLGAVRQLLGDDLLLFRSTLMLKPAHHGSAHGLHQDSSYWPVEPPALVTVSIALADASPENGCFQVIPRSHRSGMKQWGQIQRDSSESITDRNDVDPNDLVDVPLKAGSALLFHSLTVHGSRANNSSRPRHTALYAYFPPTVRYRPRPNGPREMVFPVVSGLGGKTEVTLTAEGG